MIPILSSSFATSLKRADSLAIAMEARGYQGGKAEVNTDNWNGLERIR